MSSLTIERFDRSYVSWIRSGFSTLIVASVLLCRTEDLWARGAMYGGLTVLSILLLCGHSRTRKPVIVPLGLPWIILFLTFSLSLFHTYDARLSVSELWTWFFCGVGFYLVLNIVNDVSSLESFLLGYASVIPALIVIALWQQVVDPTIKNVHASFPNSQPLAGFILGLIFILWEQRSRRMPRLLFWGGVLLLLVTRSHWATMIMGLCGVILYRAQLFQLWTRHRVRGYVFLFIFSVLMLALLMHKFQNPKSFDRYYFWLTSLQMLKHSPWTGVGIGSFATAYLHFKMGTGEHTLFAHSFPLQLLSETGLAGGLSILFFTWTAWRSTRRPANPSSSVNRTTAILKITVLGLIVFSLVNMQIDYYISRWLTLWTLACLLSLRPWTTHEIQRPWTVAASIVLIGLVPLWSGLLRGDSWRASGQRFESQGDLFKAEAAYLQSIRLNPWSGDSHWGLSRIYLTAYLRKREAKPLFQEACHHLLKAYELKKDIQIGKDIETMQRMSQP